jgi:hypothetical protein
MIEDPVKRAERWIEEAKERQELEHKNEKLQDKIDKDADWRDHWVALRQSAKQ